MDMLTLVVICLVTVVSGWIPPLILLYLERKMAHAFLQQGSELADKSLAVAEKMTEELKTAMKDLRVTHDVDVKSICDQVASRVSHAIDGKLGAEVKGLKSEVSRDPRLAAQMGVQPQNNIMDLIVRKFLK